MNGHRCFLSVRSIQVIVGVAHRRSRLPNPDAPRATAGVDGRVDYGAAMHDRVGAVRRELRAAPGARAVDAHRHHRGDVLDGGAVAGAGHDRPAPRRADLLPARRGRPGRVRGRLPPHRRSRRAADDDDQVARNVSPFTVEPGKFTYRLVRGELEFADYGQMFAHCRVDRGPWHSCRSPCCHRSDRRRLRREGRWRRVHGDDCHSPVDALPRRPGPQAISLIRGFAMDAPLHAKSGHQGTAMALAPLAHVLYSRVMQHDPADPEWPDRDRFVLSNGHASILQYSMLYLSGYGLELDDIEAFRQFGVAHARATPRPATRRASRSPPARSARASATPSAWRSPSGCLRDRFGADARRPPHVRDRRRRLLHGGRQPRGRVARRPPRPRPADLRLRRQPHHDRRRHRAGLHRRRRRALRGLRLARRAPRRDRRRLRRPRGGAARRQGRRRPPEPARPALATSATRRPTTPTTTRPTATRSPPRTSPAPRP